VGPTGPKRVRPCRWPWCIEEQAFRGGTWPLGLESIRKSLESRGEDGRLRGASTSRSKLAKNLFLSPSRKSFLRKGVEAYLSVVIEICLPQRRILGNYWNIVELGARAFYGVGRQPALLWLRLPATLVDTEAAFAGCGFCRNPDSNESGLRRLPMS